MKPAWGMLVALLAACAPPPPPSNEICGNGLDDDRNGQPDCADPACASAPECNVSFDAGYFGPCQKCGQLASRQRDCLAVSYHDDHPLPMCLEGKCNALFEGISIRFEVDTSNWSGMSVQIRSMNTRFISRTAVSGDPVTCATVAAVATSKQAPDQIEATDRFNFLAFDVAPVQGAPGTTLTQPFLPTSTGSNFLIWTELYAGPRDSNTKLPTGMRIGWGCFETGPAVEPILTQHHWPDATPTQYSRTIRVTMPPPQ